MAKLRVLFLCTENSSRSQMAEAVLRRYAGDIFESHSAGLQPRGVDPLAVKVMKEVGIDISDQWSKALEPYPGKTPFQYLITVCDEADRDCPPGRVSIPGCTGPLQIPQNSKAAKKRSLPNSVKPATRSRKESANGWSSNISLRIISIFVSLRET